MKLDNTDLKALVHKFIKLHPDFAEKIGIFTNNGIDKEISLWSDFVNEVSMKNLFDYDQYFNGLVHRIFIEFYKDNSDFKFEITNKLKETDTLYQNVKKVTNNFLLLINNQKKYDNDKYWWLYGVPTYIVDNLEKQPRQKSYTLTHSGTGIYEEIFQFGIPSKFGKVSSKEVELGTLNLPQDLITRIKNLLQIKLSEYDIREYNIEVKEIALMLKSYLKDAKVIYYNWQNEPSIVK